MARWFKNGMAAALGLGVSGAAVIGPIPARAQAVREREVSVTGPRGNTLSRDLKSVRGPGFLKRETTVHRPGGATFQSDTILRRGGPQGDHGGPMSFGGPRFGPGPWAGGPRGVIVNNYGGRGLSAGNALLDFGLGAAVGGVVGGLVGRATAPPAVVIGPPVFVQPQPVMVVPPQPVVVQSQPTYLVAPPRQVSFVPPEVGAAIGRLASRHENSRRDGCLTLGRIGDDRAVPALMDRLKNDPASDVRMAAATALGAIGDPNTAQILERSVVYDKRQEVRNASAAALERVRTARPPVIQSSGPFLDPAESYPVERVPPPPTPAISGR